MRNEEMQQQIRNVEKVLRELRCQIDGVTDRNVERVKAHLYEASIAISLAANASTFREAKGAPVS